MRHQAMLSVWLLILCLSLSSPLENSVGRWMNKCHNVSTVFIYKSQNKMIHRWGNRESPYTSVQYSKRALIKDFDTYFSIPEFETQVLKVEEKNQLLKAFHWLPHVCALFHTGRGSQKINNNINTRILSCQIFTLFLSMFHI